MRVDFYATSAQLSGPKIPGGLTRLMDKIRAGGLLSKLNPSVAIDVKVVSYTSNGDVVGDTGWMRRGGKLYRQNSHDFSHPSAAKHSIYVRGAQSTNVIAKVQVRVKP